MLPSIYETCPTEEGTLLLRLGHRGILAAVSSTTETSTAPLSASRARDSPLGPLWRLLVAARVALVPHSHDPTLLTYVATPAGMKALHSTFSSHKGCSLASTGTPCNACRILPTPFLSQSCYSKALISRKQLFMPCMYSTCVQ